MISVFVFVLLIVGSYGFYVPGVAPVEFKQGDPIEVKAVKLTSTRTQLPYEYYSFPFCTPKKGTVYKSENLGILPNSKRVFGWIEWAELKCVPF